MDLDDDELEATKKQYGLKKETKETGEKQCQAINKKENN